MKTLKYIILGVILSSLVVSSFSFSPSVKRFSQEEKVTFCETYTQQELISRLDPGEDFFKLVHMENTHPESSRVGSCHESDLDALWNYIQDEAFQSKVPQDLIIAPGFEATGPMVPLYAIRKPASDDVKPTQQDIDAASVSVDTEDNYMLLISFSESGAKKWASMTRRNIGRNIAILFEGRVLAAPRVMDEIKGGKCSISGDYTEDEIKQLKAALEI